MIALLRQLVLRMRQIAIGVIQAELRFLAAASSSVSLVL
jgi:hypothetical protein